MSRKNRALIFIFLLTAIMAGVVSSGVLDGLTLSAIQQKGDAYRAQIAEYPVLSAFVFFIVYAGIIALCLPLGSLLNLTGGFLFGVTLGGTLSLVATVTGSFVIFMMARSSIGGFLRDRASGMAAKIAREMELNAVAYLLFMRLVPVFPALATGVLPALFHISPRVFLSTALAGVAPVAFIYAYLGRELGSAQTIADLFSPGLAAALLGLGLLALTPMILQKVKARSAGRA